MPFAALAISRAIGPDQPVYQLRGATARVPDQKLAFHGNGVTYHRGPISEWHANGPQRH